LNSSKSQNQYLDFHNLSSSQFERITPVIKVINDNKILLLRNDVYVLVILFANKNLTKRFFNRIVAIKMHYRITDQSIETC